MPYEKITRRVASWLGLVTGVIGLVVLAGWWLGFDPLGAIRPGPQPMLANTAAAVVLLGFGLWNLARGGPGRLTLALAAVPIMLSVLTLAEHALGLDLGIDQLLANDRSNRSGEPNPGRMPLKSCVVLVVAAYALLASQRRHKQSRRIWASGLAILLIATALASFFISVVDSLTEFSLIPTLRLGPDIAIGLLFFGTGLFLLDDAGRLIAQLFSPANAGRLARRFFYGAVLAPLALGGLLVALLKLEVVGPREGMALYAFSLLVSGFGLALMSLRAMAELESSRGEAEAARLHLTARLQEQAAGLIEEVGLRTRELRESNASLQAAAESNARLALVANHATNGVVITDARGAMEWCNAAFQQMTGYTAEEMLAAGFNCFVPDTANDEASAGLRRALRDGTPCNVEVQNFTKGGRPFWVIIDLQPVRDAVGRLINFIAVQTEITGRRQAEEKLVAANQRLKLATAATELGVWEGFHDADTCEWDDGMLSIYGLTRAGFDGTYDDWVARLHPEDAEQARGTLRQIQDGAESFDRTFRIVRADDGAVRVVRSRAVARRDADGRLIGCTGAERDITAESEAAERQRELTARLQLALDSTAFGVWELDVATREMHWDAAMFRVYGIRPEDFMGRCSDWADRLHPEDVAAATHENRPDDRYDDPSTQRFRIIRPDGAVRHVEAHTKRMHGTGGKLLRLVGLNRDVTDQHESSRRTIELNERLQLALRSSRYGVWETDPKTGEMVWDDRMLEIYGLGRAEFDGQRGTWLRAIHPEDQEDVRGQTERVAAGEESSYRNEFRIVRPDGSVRHIEAYGQLETDASGRPLRIVGLNRDISLERKTEAALHLIEERWQLALEGNNDGVWDWDLVGGHFFYDSRYSMMMGYALGELPNNFPGHARLIHPDDREDFDQHNLAHLSGRIPFFQHEHRMQAKSGEWIWILDRAKVVNRAPDGRALRMVGTHTDITARKHLERRLAEAEALSVQVGQLALIGGWELKLAGGQIIVTPAARSILEIGDDGLFELGAFLAMFPGEARAVLQATLAGRSLPAPEFDLELPLTSARGRGKWVRVIGRAEFREERVVAIRGALQDITARHESEATRRELEGQLFQAQKMETLGTLAGGIAHDFNNLLTGIIGYHELATDTIPADHPARACLDEARGASMRARDLVEQILTFSRQSSGEEHEAVDLSLVIKEAGRFLRATLAANITIETEIPENADRVLANTTQIYQVLLNLGSNASHAMQPNGGKLRISLHAAEISRETAQAAGDAAPGRYLRLDVSDTGHGIDAATLRRIFDPFFTTKNTGEGTGLGLAVVHGIIRAHRGTIDVASTPGAGTTFQIYLPVAEQAPLADPGTREVTPTGRGQRVYAVDDEEMVGRFIKMALDNIGYRVRTFTSGEDCLAALDDPADLPELLLTDQTMPGLQGTELAAAMQARLPELPVIIMSGYFSKVPTQSLGELRNAHLLAKPFTTDELAHALGRALPPAAPKPDGGSREPGFGS